MTLCSLHSKFAGFCAAAMVIMVCGQPASRGTITVGLKPTNMTPDQYYELAVQEAQRDLERKKAVGIARYNQRVAAQVNAIKAMQSELERRRAEIPSNYSISTPLEEVVAKGPDWGRWFLATLLAVIAGWIGWIHWKGRKLQERSEFSFAQKFAPANTAPETVLQRKQAAGATPSRLESAVHPKGSQHSRQVSPSRSHEKFAPGDCYNCGKSSSGLPQEKVDFCGEAFGMCPTCAEKHRESWAN